MPNEPLSPRPIRLSQKLRGLSRLRSRGIEDKGETEEFRMVHTPDRPHRIITPVEAPSEEECGDTISSWHKAVKNDSDSDEEGEKHKPARSYWKTDYTGGHPGQFQSQHHESHTRGHSHVYTPSGLSQEVHVDSFQSRSRGVRRSVSEHHRRTFSESPVPSPLVPNKSKQRQAHLHHTPSPAVKQSMERDISRGRGREKGDHPKTGGGAATTYSLPRDYRIKAMESPRRGQCPYCRCQLGNRTYLTCPNPPCRKGLTTFEGSWIAPPKLKDRRPASPSIFGVIGRQLLGRPLKSSPDSIGSLPSQQKRSGTNTPEALATLPESIASIGTQRYRTPPPPPTSTSRQAQRAKASSPTGTTWSSFAQAQGKQSSAKQVVGFERERKRLPPPVHIEQHPRFESPNNTSYLRGYSSGSSSGASTPTPSHSPSPAPPRRPAGGQQQTVLPLRPAAQSQSQTLRAPASLNNLQPATPNKQALVSKFSTGQLQQPSSQAAQNHPPYYQNYPESHISSALSSPLPTSQQPPTAKNKGKTPEYLDWIPPSERSLFYPKSAYSSPPAPSPQPPKKSARRSQSQHTFSQSQSQSQPKQHPPTTQPDDSQSDDYLADIYDQYGEDNNHYGTDDTTKAEGGMRKQKSWTSSKYSTDTADTTDTAHSTTEKGGGDITDDDDDNDKWNQLEDESQTDTPTQLKPTPPLSGKGQQRQQARGKGGGNYRAQAEGKGLRVATGVEEGKTGREGSKDRLARELEMRRLQWL
ncbi:hypothetical protein B0T21DRAFT_382319 [Apiosordaria backusii]|uniref:Uncharacterized protein n=1 Tax=Apiosordaria backusii TaxID=314023 RepID=A0AA40EHN1_9PEZI|nr:hypothetical protein B0T21DRAFT_382319 [Apiosordaria backusii]